MNRKQLALVVLCIAVLVWSVTGVMAKAVPWDPLSLACGRNLFSFLTVLLVCRPRRLVLNRMTVLSGLACGGATSFFLASMRLGPGLNGVVLCYTAPLFSALIGRVAFGKRLERGVVPALVLSGIGLALMVADQHLPTTVAATACSFGTGTCYGLWATIRAKRPNDGRRDDLLLGFALPLLFFPWAVQQYEQGQLLLNQTVVLNLVIGGSVAASAYLLLARIVGVGVSAPSALLISAAEVPLTVVWIALFLDEVPGVVMAIGGTMIFAASLAVARIEGRQAPTAGEEGGVKGAG